MIMLCISSVGGNCLLSCFKVLTLAGVSCGSLVFLFRPAHHDLQRIIWQWPLQRLALSHGRPHPNVTLLVGGQDYRHRLRMDRLDHRVRRCREKTIDLMRPRYRLRLRAAITVERRPDASEAEQGAVIVEREPHHVLFLCLRVRLRCVLGEAVGRHIHHQLIVA
jgi:hypothetical protein